MKALSIKRPKAKKQHVCDFCGLKIEIGEVYELQNNVNEGTIYQWKSHLECNKIALERILDNLLTNACKYNKKNGTVFIDIIKNKMTIRDTGVGIKNTTKIFQRYYKENETGLGIGMSIVKKLCDMLEISISVKSVINEGTTIVLLFKKDL